MSSSGEGSSPTQTGGQTGAFSHGGEGSRRSRNYGQKSWSSSLPSHQDSSLRASSAHRSLADVAPAPHPPPASTTSRAAYEVEQHVHGDSSAPWNTVLQAIAELRSDMDKLKAERRQEGLLKPNSNTDARPGASTARDDAEPDMPSPGNFSGFLFEEGSCEEGEIHGDNPVCSVLMQTSKAFGPVEEVSCDVDKHVADMVNQLFDHGMREDSYKEVAEDEITKRPGNCPALSPVECNVQILEALKQDARKVDLRMKDVNKDILKAATIIIKSLSVLDKEAQDEGNSVVAHEVGMINGALALLGHANYRNNLVRCFNIKWEINQKYAHLYSDKVPMTRFLFGDDLSQSAKQIKESE
ncbi:hypothetical protein E2C01_022516 [Portunus trituberculatus]|uniref:Uncharacterized protein n=1 Tax=Portunus trituberculatus TaxID=210409 RepID=A0A5B7E5J8_PORTR|nr:hypothetical protein [Portunus trituberculatus]